MAFTGFDHEAAGWFRALAAHNDKDWFEAHRDDWQRLVQDPMEDLLAEAERRYGPGRVLRQHRDVRFSPDKTPYRTNAGLTAGGVYLSASADGLEVGGGLYEPSRDQLHAARTTIDERPHAAAALRSTLDDLVGDGFALAGPDLRTAPRGYPKDHARIDLLRMQHYAALQQHPLDSGLDVIVATWEQVQPLVRWTRKWADGDAEDTDDPAPGVPDAGSLSRG